MKRNIGLVNRPIPSKPSFHPEELSMSLPELAGQDKCDLYFR